MHYLLSSSEEAVLADVDECASNPCHNNGTCKDGIDKFECQCVREFEGKCCEVGECNKCQVIFLKLARTIYPGLRDV